MHAVRVALPVLKGLSFEVTDLILLQSWSAAVGLRMLVNLDCGCDVDEYEEVLTFFSGTSTVSHWIMWRNATTVFVQPTVGRRRRFRSVARAIEALERKQRVALTDIRPTAWPSQTAS
jgi:hypothetical protein